MSYGLGSQAFNLFLSHHFYAFQTSDAVGERVNSDATSSESSVRGADGSQQGDSADRPVALDHEVDHEAQSSVS
jgi:hypothetical protein